MSCLTCPSEFPAHPDTLICGHCFYGLARLLDPDHVGDKQRPETNPPSIPVLHHLLDPAKKTAQDRGRAAPGFATAVPIDTHHVAMRDRRSKANGIAWFDRAGRQHWETDRPPLSPQAVLEGWAAVVCDTRHVAYPVPRDPWTRPETYLGPMTAGEHRTHLANPRPRVDPAVLGGFLRVHLEWAAGHDWIVDLARELHTLSGQLRTAVQTATGEYRPKPIATCHAIVDHDEHGAPVECGGPLFPPRMGDRIGCGSCGAVLTADQWFPVLEQAAS